MSARSHETDGPAPGEPDGSVPDDPAGVTPAGPDDTAGVAPAGPDGATASGAASGGDAAEPSHAASDPDPDPLAPDEVDARFTDIVTHLRTPSDPRSWAPDPEVEEAEDHFVPPEPEPVFGGDPLLTMAWCAVVGVPLLLLVVAVAWRDVPTWVLQVAGAAFIAGAGLLLWRMPHDREDDDGPGAVV
jgi:hypothetical protein